MALSDANFNADLASKLDRLEAGTALLERDARNRRALLIELGLAPHTSRSRMLRWAAAQSRWLATLAAAGRAGLDCLAALERALRSPHLATAVRVTWSWLREGVVIAAFACATLIPFMLAILLLAPPE